jgi:RNA polymerase sigma-70 factor (ECF subfamily)
VCALTSLKRTRGKVRPSRALQADKCTSFIFLKWPLSAGVMFLMGPESLGRLVDAHAAALVLYAQQWCAAPEDVVQEAFVKLAAQARPPAHPVAWLYQVVRNRALSAARSARRRQRHESAAASARPAWFSATATDLDADAAAAALGRLPLEQRETVVAHLWGGLTFEQIGELTQVSASTAYRRYLLALETLRERLGVSCPNHR